MKISAISSLEDMILICMDNVIKAKGKCSFGNLVKECFLKFPKYFSLNDVPEHPDSLKLDRPLRELRQKGLIVGSPVTFYSITNFGKTHLVNISREKAKIVSDNETTTRSPAMQTLDKLKSSFDYDDFQNNGAKFEPNDMKIRSILGFTLETPINKIVHELDFLIDFAQNLDKLEVINYLKRYKSFFGRKS